MNQSVEKKEQPETGLAFSTLDSSRTSNNLLQFMNAKLTQLKSRMSSSVLLMQFSLKCKMLLLSFLCLSIHTHALYVMDVNAGWSRTYSKPVSLQLRLLLDA